MVSEAEPTQHISRDDVRDTIGRIWKEVLRLEEFGYGDNFFELGGHSLTASQAIARISRTLRVEIPMADFFERPTVEELTDFVTRKPEHDERTSAAPADLVTRQPADGERASTALAFEHGAST